MTGYQVFIVIYYLALPWIAVCTVRASLARRRMLAGIKGVLGTPSWPQAGFLLEEFRIVSYERHIWQLLTFRNGLALYHEKLRALAGAA